MIGIKYSGFGGVLRNTGIILKHVANEIVHKYNNDPYRMASCKRFHNPGMNKEDTCFGGYKQRAMSQKLL